MKIRINGEDCELDCANLAQLLDELGHTANQVATAVNQEFVPAAERARCILSDGDSVDVIAPMSGG